MLWLNTLIIIVYDECLIYSDLSMWVNTESFCFLETNKNLFFDKNILTIGRQTNYINFKLLSSLWILKEEYTDNIWTQRRKVKRLDSVDYSDYESPTYTRDFNQPIDQNLYSKYDVIFDGWSTEHMFNPMQAFYNYHNMLRIWGYYIGILPMNNHVNHWFYQFSPDFFYSLFSQERWYKTSCFAFRNSKRYKIKDLREFDEVYHANLTISSYPNLIYVISQKIEEKDIFLEYPKQTVYNNYLRKTNSSNIESQQEKSVSFMQKIYFSIIPNYIKNMIENHMVNKKMLIKITKPIF